MVEIEKQNPKKKNSSNLAIEGKREQSTVENDGGRERQRR